MVDWTWTHVGLIFGRQASAGLKDSGNAPDTFGFEILSLLLVLLLAALWWWVKKKERKYPAAERTAKIAEALREGRDVRIVYWSKSRGRFVREIVTPKAVSGPHLRAHDHSKGIDRRFNITRIKQIVVLPHPALGSGAIPEEQSPRNLRLAILALLLVVVALLVALRRDARHNDFTYRAAELPTTGVEPAGTDQGLSNALPAVVEKTIHPASPVATNHISSVPVESGLKNSRGYYDRACLLNDRGDVAGVVEYCTRAIESDPYYAQAYCLRALARVMDGDFSGTVSDCNRAINLNPRYIQAYYFRGGALDASGELRSAIADYSKAIEYRPSFADAFNARAWSWYRLGDLDKSLQDVNQAIALNSRSANAYDTRGWTRYAKGDKDGAVADCCRAVLLDRQGAVGYSSGGLLYYITGEYRDAVSSWNQASQMDASARVYLEPWIKKAREHMAEENPATRVLAAW